ncbi:unnamed protein product [Macrosiphum euphorbiae]|uniref:Uncharacterized protein n=1 Tax=Macrosiphum euphorbiae TaxID=13131 RepID=A0AAV0W0V9_9HEMI|nr:unnamed protein product [Macrosiphum euphorbiae]
MANDNKGGWKKNQYSSSAQSSKLRGCCTGGFQCQRSQHHKQEFSSESPGDLRSINIGTRKDEKSRSGCDETVQGRRDFH